MRIARMRQACFHLARVVTAPPLRRLTKTPDLRPCALRMRTPVPACEHVTEPKRGPTTTAVRQSEAAPSSMGRDSPCKGARSIPKCWSTVAQMSRTV